MDEEIGKDSWKHSKTRDLGLSEEGSEWGNKNVNNRKEVPTKKIGGTEIDNKEKFCTFQI